MKSFQTIIREKREKEKLARLYEEHKAFLLNYAVKYYTDRAGAEEALQETFLTIIENKEKYLELNRLDFRRLAVTIMKHKCIDAIRRETVRRHRPFDDAYYEDPSGVVENDLIRREEMEILKDALETLSDKSRKILILKYVEGLTYREIATRLDMSEAYVQTVLYRARQKLKKILRRRGRE